MITPLVVLDPHRQPRSTHYYQFKWYWVLTTLIFLYIFVTVGYVIWMSTLLVELVYSLTVGSLPAAFGKIVVSTTLYTGVIVFHQQYNGAIGGAFESCSGYNRPFQGGVLRFLAYVYVVGCIAGLTYALVQI